MAAAPTGPCRLCLRQRPLCQSHIIPESCFTPVYDAKHRFITVTESKERLTLLQKGFREPLLCDKCEQHLNAFDHYFADAWFQQGLGPLTATDDLVTVSGLDYSTFKLFHLSVLWRAAIASRPEFAGVQLGPHAERIRDMLLRADPGPTSQYGTIVYALCLPRSTQICRSIVTRPKRVRLEGHWGYHFVFGGCVWHHFVSSHPSQYESCFLTHHGTLRMMRMHLDHYAPVVEVIRKRRARGWRAL
jgi:hypothetical protein